MRCFCATAPCAAGASTSTCADLFTPTARACPSACSSRRQLAQALRRRPQSPDRMARKPAGLEPWLRDGKRVSLGQDRPRRRARDIPHLIDHGLAIGGAASAIGTNFLYANFTGPATAMGLLLAQARAGSVRRGETSARKTCASITSSRCTRVSPGKMSSSCGAGRATPAGHRSSSTAASTWPGHGLPLDPSQTLVSHQVASVGTHAMAGGWAGALA